MLEQSSYDDILAYVETQIALVESESSLALMWEGYLLKAAVKHQRESDFLKRSKHPIFHQLNSLLLLKENRWEEVYQLYIDLADSKQSASHYVLAADIAENKLDRLADAQKCYQFAKNTLVNNPQSLSTIVQQHLCRLAAQNENWSAIIEQISELNPTNEDNIMMGLINIRD